MKRSGAISNREIPRTSIRGSSFAFNHELSREISAVPLCYKTEAIFYIHSKPFDTTDNNERIFKSSFRRRWEIAGNDINTVKLRMGIELSAVLNRKGEVTMRNDDKPNQAKIMINGYSERGLVNALFESIAVSADACSNLQELLRYCTSNEELRKHCEKMTDFEIYIEPSLSDFGNPDVVLFIKGDSIDSSITDIIKPQSKDLCVIFIEAKLCPFLSSSPLPSNVRHPYNANASTILHELFLKARFCQCIKKEMDLNLGQNIYVTETGKMRKIGTDEMVLQLARRIKSSTYQHFIALTTDKNPSDTIVHTDKGSMPVLDCIQHLIAHIYEENETEHSSYLGDNFSLLSWLNVYEFAKANLCDISYERLLRTLDGNISKLSFPTNNEDTSELIDVDSLMTMVQSDSTFKHNSSRGSGKDGGSGKNTIYHMFYDEANQKFTNRAFITYRKLTGFEDTDLFEIYVAQKDVRDKLLKQFLPVKKLVEIQINGMGFEWFKQAFQFHIGEDI